jgi:putative (di)nucleoside polyphosphate hydrolase
MQLPTLEEIDEIRKTGFRPQVVACFLKDKKILFMYKKDYHLWQIPQGGIDNGEELEEAVGREMKEELGGDFIKNIEVDLLVRRNAIEFSIDRWNSRDLGTDDGQQVLMKGKEYFFMTINAGTTELDIDQTEFDDYKWLDYEESLDTTKTIYQTGKKRITEDLINVLHELDLL